MHLCYSTEIKVPSISRFVQRFLNMNMMGQIQSISDNTLYLISISLTPRPRENIEAHSPNALLSAVKYNSNAAAQCTRANISCGSIQREHFKL